MPRQAIALGAAQEVVPLADMPRRLKEICGGAAAVPPVPFGV
jgi:chemotaxis response regulator CheB